MAKICRILPQGIQEKKNEIRTFMPKFGCISERRNQLHEVIRLSGMNIIINDIDYPLLLKVASVQTARIQFYFIDNDMFFFRKYKFRNEDENIDYQDNDERAIFFTRSVIETVKKLSWKPDIIHCHGWFSALIPFFMKKIYNNEPLFTDKPKIIYSIYENEKFDTLNKDISKKISNIEIKQEDISLLQNPTWENLNKFAINYSDGVIFTENNPDEQLQNFTINTKKIFLPNVEMENIVKKYQEFYEQMHHNK